MLAAIPIIGNLIKTGGELLNNWQKKKVIQAEGKIKIAEAKVDGEIKRVQTITEQQGEYNIEAQKGMASSWKDEVFVITWLAILVGCFLPWSQEYVKEGFTFLLSNTPWWYESSLIAMIVASFGLKGWKMWKK